MTDKRCRREGGSGTTLNEAECNEATRMHRDLWQQGDPYAVPKVVEHFLRKRLSAPTDSAVGDEQ